MIGHAMDRRGMGRHFQYALLDEENPVEVPLRNEDRYGAGREFANLGPMATLTAAVSAGVLGVSAVSGQNYLYSQISNSEGGVWCLTAFTTALFSVWVNRQTHPLARLIAVPASFIATLYVIGSCPRGILPSQ